MLLTCRLIDSHMSGDMNTLNGFMILVCAFSNIDLKFDWFCTNGEELIGVLKRLGRGVKQK